MANEQKQGMKSGMRADYYTTAWRKTLDFLLGFIGSAPILWLFPAFLYAAKGDIAALMEVILLPGLLVFLGVFFFNSKLCPHHSQNASGRPASATTTN